MFPLKWVTPGGLAELNLTIGGYFCKQIMKEKEKKEKKK